MTTTNKTEAKALTEREVVRLLKENAKEANDKLKATEKNISARLATTNKEVKKLATTVEGKVSTALEKQVKRLEKLNSLVKLDKRISDMEHRLEFIGERLRLLIHKETILTELSRIARDKQDALMLAQFHLAIMKAYNQEDEWWNASGHEMEISEWWDRIFKLLEE